MKNFWHNGEKYRVLHRGIQFLNAMELIQKIEIFPLSKVLDIGCGTGDLLIYLAKMYKDSSFCGIDLSESMLTIARETAEKEKLKNIRFVKVDIVTTQLNEYFDVIFSNAAFHWFKDRINGDTFKKLINPQGVIAVHTAGTDSSVDNILDKTEQLFLQIIEKLHLSEYYINYVPFKSKRLTCEELSNIFKDFGFSIVEHGFVLRKTFFSSINEYMEWLDSSGNMMFELLPVDKKEYVYNEFIKSLSTSQTSFDSYHASSFCIATLPL